ncbi:MAG TPA: polysaccharide deacetylase family protein [Acidimicrobiia bacterium]|nr:polysaccharide deacetylase family protein [Acidimicrobiia bacterium]
MRLAVTIDVEARDHPCREGNFRAVVDALVGAGAPATLFVQGGWVGQRATADELDALRADGMEVGLHGHTHRRFTELTADEIVGELAAADQALTGVGVPPVRPLFRLPYLAGNTDAFVLQTVAVQGWWHVDCHAVAYDWRDDVRHDPVRVAQHVIDDVEGRRRDGADCAILLFHSWPDPTPEATRILLEHARAHADELVRVTDLPRRAWTNPVTLS